MKTKKDVMHDIRKCIEGGKCEDCRLFYDNHCMTSLLTDALMILEREEDNNGMERKSNRRI